MTPFVVIPLNSFRASPGVSSASDNRSNSAGGRRGGAFGVCDDDAGRWTSTPATNATSSNTREEWNGTWGGSHQRE